VPVEGSGASTRVYALETTPGYDATPGAMQSTGRNLDVAMQGDAWLAVQALDGTEAYTRGGSLDVAADGTLVTTSGLTVLGDGGPIQIPPDVQLAIGADGTISATAVNGKSTTVGRLKLVTPEAPLTRGTDGLFRADADLPADASARLQDGALEGSNVSAVETMIQMIAAARQFEAQMKILTTAEGDEKAAAQLLSTS
jgi:flagellar basal-body rod protein FlgF